MSGGGTAGPHADGALRPCPCGRLDGRRRPVSYAECCGPYHAGDRLAPDAEALMRSRYSAFVLGLLPYLNDTWHPGSRPADLSLEDDQKWLGLEVKRYRPIDDAHAEVEFVARSRIGGRGVRLHEISRFVLEDGHWLYVDGDLK